MAILYLVVGIRLNKQEGRGYSILSYYPFELTEGLDYKKSVFMRVLEGLSLLSSLTSIVLFIVLSGQVGWDRLGFLIAIAIFYLGSELSFLFISIVNLYFPKQHLAVYFLFAFSSLCKAGMVGIYLINAYHDTLKVAVIVLASLSFLVGLFDLFAIVNPRLKNWDKMDKDVDASGLVSYKRPKVSALAASEWFLYFFNLAVDIIAAIGLFLSLPIR
jgi:hypothetical protein